MKVASSSLLFITLHLAGLAVSAPPRRPSGKHQPLEEEQFTQSLYDLVHSRRSRGASKLSEAKFHHDFANHPSIKNINFDDSNSDDTIKKLFDLRLPVDKDNKETKVFNQKLTMELYRLIKDKVGEDSSLLEKFDLQNYQRRKREANKRFRARFRDGEQVEILRSRQRGYETKRRQRKKIQKLQASEKDQPMDKHLIESINGDGAKRLTAAEVVERANGYRHLYSTGPSFTSAVRAYLHEHAYTPEETKTSVERNSRQKELQRVKGYNAKWKSALKSRHEAGQPSQPTLAREGPTQSKKRKISEVLATTDWYGTHHL